MTAEAQALDRPDWQRAPFEPGNVAALRSGAHSPRVYGVLAQELAAGLVDERPDLARYGEAVGIWATFQAQFLLKARAVGDGAADDGDLGWLLRLGNAAAKAGAALGMDPTSEARLTRDRAAAAALASAVDLGALAERGRAALAARDAAAGEPPVDLPGLVLDQFREATAAATDPQTYPTERTTDDDDDH